MDTTGNLVAPEVWESRWQQIRDPLRLDFRSPGIRVLTDLFRRVLPLGEKSLIEVGCGGSAWLPFFAAEMGYRVSGIDLSPAGVLLARKNLEAFGMDGHIIEGDVFDPELLRGKAFDVVFSLGFIEHFPETSSVVARMSELLKPGGLLLTVVPNMQGLPGFVQRLIDRPVFDQHVVMDRHYLERLHKEAGLETVAGPDYLGGFNLWGLSLVESLLRGRSQTFVRAFGKLIAALHLTVNLGLRLWGVPNGRWMSQMIVIGARKGEAAGEARGGGRVAAPG